MTGHESWEPQEPLPGLGDVDFLLGDYMRAVRQNAKAQEQHAANEAWVGCVQDTVWADYCKQIVGPRRQIWDRTVYLLENEPGVAWLLRSASETSRPRLCASWKFVRQEQQEDAAVELYTTMYTARKLTDLPDDVYEAYRYLYDNKSVDPKNLPNTLLGVQAEGKRKNKGFPRHELAQRLQHEFLRGIEDLHVETKANALGFNMSKVLFEKKIDKSYCDEMHRPLDFQPSRYKAQEITEKAYASARADGTSDPVEAYLRGSLCTMGSIDWHIGTNFEVFQQALALIDGSHSVRSEPVASYYYEGFYP